MMKKKFLTMILAGAAALGLLSGCGGTKAPDAAGLLAGAFPDGKSIAADIGVTVDVDVDMGEEFGNSVMNMAMAMDCGLVQDTDTAGMAGTVHAELFGMTMDENLESWAQRDGASVASYDKDPETGIWTVAYGETDGTEEYVSLGMDVSLLNGLTIEKDKDSGCWKVSGTVAAEDFDMLGATDLDTIGVPSEGLQMQVSVLVDQKTGWATAISASVEPCEADGTKVNTFAIEVRNISFTDDAVNVPADVIAAAAPYDEVYGGMDDSFGGYDGDEAYSSGSEAEAEADDSGTDEEGTAE